MHLAYCQFETGAAIGGTWKDMKTNTVSQQQCAFVVGTKEPLANGVTWVPPGHQTSKQCVAVYGTTHISTTEGGCITCQNCIFHGRLTVLPTKKINILLLIQS